MFLHSFNWQEVISSIITKILLSAPLCYMLEISGEWKKETDVLENEYFSLGRESIKRKSGRNKVMCYISQLSFIINSWRWSALTVKYLLRLGQCMTCLLLLAHVRAAYCGMITWENSSLVQTKAEKEQKEEKWGLSYHHPQGHPLHVNKMSAQSHFL